MSMMRMQNRDIIGRFMTINKTQAVNRIQVFASAACNRLIRNEAWRAGLLLSGLLNLRLVWSRQPGGYSTKKRETQLTSLIDGFTRL